jgi:signal transduction histidine kinase
LRSLGHHNPSGEIGEYVVVTMDITERKQAEQERERLRNQVITSLLSRCIIGQAKPKWS